MKAVKLFFLNIMQTESRQTLLTSRKKDFLFLVAVSSNQTA